jgi:hypothetical protein
MKELHEEAELEKQKNDWVGLHTIQLTTGKPFGASIALSDHTRWKA